jgi:2-methylcitrate dehydratase
VDNFSQEAKLNISKKNDLTVDTIVSYAASLSYNDLTTESISEAKRRVIDSIAIAFAGYEEDCSKFARKLALSSQGTPGSTLLGTEHLCYPELATLANGTMLHSQDFMDTYLSKESLHPSDTICAILAAAEMTGANGKEVILGIVLAYEVMCRLADVANVRERGWDHVVFGVIASSIASAKVMKLSVEQMKETLALAVVSNTALRQTRVGEVPMWKAFAPANAASNGLLAARLASMGVTGPVEPFQGEKGFERQVSGPLIFTDFGSKKTGYRINQCYIKVWPIQYNTQAGVQAVLLIRDQITDFDTIEKIIIDISEIGRILSADTQAKWDPQTRETADHSLPYIVVSALIDGEIKRETFDRESFRNERKLSLVQRVEVRADPDFTKSYPEKLSVRVSIRTSDGTTHLKQVDIPKGHYLDPLSDIEVEEKFTRFVSRKLTDAQTKIGLNQLWNLDQATDIGKLMRSFAIKSH